MKRVFLGLYFVAAIFGVGLAWTQDVSNPQTNATALTSGTLPAARLPALTGNVTSSAGSAVTTLAAGSASNLDSGTLAAARGGAGTINGALKGNGSGTVSQAACADLSNATSYCLAAVGQLPGTTTSDAATAGNIGEYKAATAAASAVSLTTTTAANCVTLSLTAGDWEVSGNASYVGNAATTISYSRASVSASTGTEGTVSGTFYGANVAYFGTVNGAGFTVAAPAVRVSLSSTSNVFMEGFASFGVNTLTCGGTINAWRVR